MVVSLYNIVKKFFSRQNRVRLHKIRDFSCSRSEKTLFFCSAFVWKCTDMCKHRFGVQMLQNPPLCRSTKNRPNAAFPTEKNGTVKTQAKSIGTKSFCSNRTFVVIIWQSVIYFISRKYTIFQICRLEFLTPSLPLPPIPFVGANSEVRRFYKSLILMPHFQMHFLCHIVLCILHPSPSGMDHTIRP